MKMMFDLDARVRAFWRGLEEAEREELTRTCNERAAMMGRVLLACDTRTRAALCLNSRFSALGHTFCLARRGTRRLPVLRFNEAPARSKRSPEKGKRRGKN